MYKKIQKLEGLLGQIEDSLNGVKKTELTAAQALKIDNINLSDNAVVNINMSNILFGAVNIVSEARGIIEEIADVFPNPDRNLGMLKSLLHYKTHLIKDAMDRSDGNKTKAAELLGVKRTLITMHAQKHCPELLKFRREEKNV